MHTCLSRLVGKSIAMPRLAFVCNRFQKHAQSSKEMKLYPGNLGAESGRPTRFSGRPTTLYGLHHKGVVGSGLPCHWLVGSPPTTSQSGVSASWSFVQVSDINCTQRRDKASRWISQQGDSNMHASIVIQNRAAAVTFI